MKAIQPDAILQPGPEGIEVWIRSGRRWRPPTDDEVFELMSALLVLANREAGGPSFDDLFSWPGEPGSFRQ